LQILLDLLECVILVDHVLQLETCEDVIVEAVKLFKNGLDLILVFKFKLEHESSLLHGLILEVFDGDLIVLNHFSNSLLDESAFNAHIIEAESILVDSS